MPNRTTDTTAILSICFPVAGLALGPSVLFLGFSTFSSGLWRTMSLMTAWALPGPLAVLGIALGHVSRSNMRRDPESGGRGLANAGLIVGYVLFGAWLTLIPVAGFLFSAP